MLDPNGNRQRAHYDGLRVDFIAEAISTLGEQAIDGFQTYHVLNPYDDGIGLDEYIDAGYPIEADRRLRHLAAAVRNRPACPAGTAAPPSLLPLLHDYQHPMPPIRDSVAPAERFRSAIQKAKVGPDNDIPQVTPQIIVK